MSLKANKHKIWLFIAGAAVFGLAMFYYFGGNRLIVRHETFTLYFQDVVSGLRPGAQVKFKGVPIGFVSALNLNNQEQPGDQPVRVTIKIDADRIQKRLGVLEDLSDPQVRQRIIDRGLRGQLQMEQFVAGTLFVDLDYYPHAPPPAPYEQGADVIPTIPSDTLDAFQQFEQTLKWLPKFDFAGEAARISNDIDSAAMRVQFVPFAEYSRAVIHGLQPLSELDTSPWHDGLGNFSARLDNANDVLANADGQFPQQSHEFLTLITSTGQNLLQFRQELSDVRGGVNPQSPWHAQFIHTLDDISLHAKQLTRQINAYQAQPGLFAQPEKAPPSGANAPASE